MRKVGNIFLDNLPTIDLHGYDRDIARVMTNDFVMDNVLLNNDKIVIIHGIGSGVLKNTTQLLFTGTNGLIQMLMAPRWA